MSLTLIQAIEAVYTAFASTPKPQVIVHCPCCIEDDDVSALLIMPLRGITPDQLCRYASKVFLTVGDTPDYRYFLPRILEISATDSGWWPDPEVVGRSLRDAEWLTWDVREKNAITQLYRAKFEAISAGSDPYELDSWICGMAIAGLDLAPYLSTLEANPSATLDYYTRNSDPSSGIRLANGFWSDSSTGAQQVIAWFYSPAVSGLILESYGVDLHHIGKPGTQRA